MRRSLCTCGDYTLWDEPLRRFLCARESVRAERLPTGMLDALPIEVEGVAANAVQQLQVGVRHEQEVRPRLEMVQEDLSRGGNGFARRTGHLRTRVLGPHVRAAVALSTQRGQFAQRVVD